MIPEWRNARQRNGAQVTVTAHRRTVYALTVLLLAPLTVAREATREPPGPPKRLNLAVLDLENQTGDPELAHWRYAAILWSKSLQEVKALHVLSHEAVRYAGRQAGLRPGDPIDPNRARRMGEIIEAQRVLWGTYSKKDGHWRVGLRLMNVATGTVSPELSAEAGDWFDLRDNLGKRILSELGLTLSPEEKKKAAERWTRSAEALDWYLRERLSEEQHEPASEWERLLRKAIAADANCAAAHCELAGTLATQGKHDLAQETAQAALRLQPDCARAHYALGWIALSRAQLDPAQAAFRLDQAGVEFRHAMELDPDDAACQVDLAAVCMARGKLDEATGLLERAVALDRTNAEAYALLANACAIQKRGEEALRQLEEARRYLPEGPRAANVLSRIAAAYERLGRRSEALEYHEQTLPLGREMGANPNIIRLVERQIERIKSAMTPTFIQASRPGRYAPETLDEILRAKLTDRERQIAGHPFVCTDAMRQWAKELTHGVDKDLDKAKAIFDELSARLDTQGQPRSRTAREVFDAWKDPEVRLVCMDKAVLFVALARAVDVNAFFVHVTKLPDGTVMNHACAAVFLGDRALLVDPAQHWLGIPHGQYAILDDLKAAAFLCFNNREGDAARLAAYRAGLKLWPDSLQGRVFLVDALYGAGRAPEARRVFAEIPPPQSEDWEAAVYWTCAGQSAVVEQNWERAQECLRKSIAIWPGQSDAHFNLGRVYVQEHRLAEARAEFRACLRYELSDQVARIAQTALAQINEEIGADSASGTTGTEQKPQ